MTTAPRAYSASVLGSRELREVRELVSEGLAWLNAPSATVVALPAFSAIAGELTPWDVRNF